MEAHKDVRARPKGSERLITNFEDRFADRLALIVSHVMCLRRIWTLKLQESLQALSHYHKIISTYSTFRRRHVGQLGCDCGVDPESLSDTEPSYRGYL